MAFKWGSEAAPYYDGITPNVEISATKNDGTNYTTVQLRTYGLDFEGPMPSAQNLADFYGLIYAALNSAGWTTTINYLGAASKPLEAS